MVSRLTRRSKILWASSRARAGGLLAFCTQGEAGQTANATRRKSSVRESYEKMKEMQRKVGGLGRYEGRKEGRYEGRKEGGKEGERKKTKRTFFCLEKRKTKRRKKIFLHLNQILFFFEFFEFFFLNFLIFLKTKFEILIFLIFKFFDFSVLNFEFISNSF